PSLSRASVRSMFALNKYALNRLDSSWKFKKYEKIDRGRVNSYFKYTILCVTGSRYKIEQNILIQMTINPHITIVEDVYVERNSRSRPRVLSSMTLIMYTHTHTHIYIYIYRDRLVSAPHKQYIIYTIHPITYLLISICAPRKFFKSAGILCPHIFKRLYNPVAAGTFLACLTASILATRVITCLCSVRPPIEEIRLIEYQTFLA